MYLLSYPSYLLTEPPEDADPEEDDELPPLPDELLLDEDEENEGV